MTTHTAIKLPAQNLEPKAFAPYGEIIRPRTSSAETAVEEPKLTLTNGTPRLRIMDLKKRGLVFADMARHRRVSQCLGSMQGKEWFIGVAPPNDLADGTSPELDRIAAFRIPGDCLIELHVGTWHAGPHFVHEECLFCNLEKSRHQRARFRHVRPAQRISNSSWPHDHPHSLSEKEGTPAGAGLVTLALPSRAAPPPRPALPRA
jgi:ureidoglycolate hydrolase